MHAITSSGVVFATLHRKCTQWKSQTGGSRGSKCTYRNCCGQVAITRWQCVNSTGAVLCGMCALLAFVDVLLGKGGAAIQVQGCGYI